MTDGVLARVTRSMTAWRAASALLAVAVGLLAAAFSQSMQELDRRMTEDASGLSRRIAVLERLPGSPVEVGELRRRIELLELQAHAVNGARPDEERMRLLVEIRERIHRSVPLGKPGVVFDFDLPSSAWRASVVSGDIPHLCGGMSLLYLSALAATGIPARYVGLFERADGSGRNHASVEAYVGGRWIASDPRFNTMYRVGGNWAGYADIRAALEAGISVEVVTSPHGVLPGRHPDEHPISLAELVRFIHLHPSTVVETGCALMQVPEQLIPEGWDAGALGHDVRRVTQPAVGIYQWLRAGSLQ